MNKKISEEEIEKVTRTVKEEIGYMCLTDYLHELGCIKCTVFGSLEELKEEKPCVKNCGIMKVKVSQVEVIQKCNWGLT